MRSNGSDRGLLLLHHRDGSVRTWQYHNRLTRDADGKVSVMSSAQDVTNLRDAEEAARHSEQQIRMITDALPLRVAYLDTELRFVFVNGLYERLYGRHRDQITGKHLSEILDAETLAARLPHLNRALAGKRQHFEVERSGLGRPCFDEVTFLPDFATDGRTVLGLYVMAQDITMQKQEEQRLVELAQFDSLTGLLNRSGLMERLHRALERSDDQHSSLAVLYMDLDGFKQVNDVHGHAVGDWVLESVAGRLQNIARVSDSLGRLGGDEFVLVMEGLDSHEPAVEAARRIQKAIREPIALREVGTDQDINVGISVGIAMHGSSSEDAATILKRADAALYEAKRGGRGTWKMAE